MVVKSAFARAQEEISDEEVAFALLAGTIVCPGWVHKDPASKYWEQEVRCILCASKGYLETEWLSSATIKLLIWGDRHNEYVLKPKV